MTLGKGYINQFICVDNNATKAWEKFAEHWSQPLRSSVFYLQATRKELFQYNSYDITNNGKNISIYKWSSLIIYVFLCILVLDFKFLVDHVEQCLYKTEIIHFHPNFIAEKSATLTITQSSEHLRPHTVCI